MQICNVIVRLNGSMLHTVPKTGVTPAEILVLQRIHGNDAVVEVRPVKFEKNRSHLKEYDRLASIYDNAASASAPGEEGGSIMGLLFPGAMKKLPRTLKEIGMAGLAAPEVEAEVEVEEVLDTDEEPAADEVDPFTPAEEESEAA